VLDPLAAETVLSTGTADASGAQGPKWRRVDFTVPVSGQSTLRPSWTGTADMRADGNPSNDPDTVPPGPDAAGDPPVRRRRLAIAVLPDLPEHLGSLVRSTPWLLEALRAARDVDPPDWLVGGGVLRDLVWDHLHGRPPAPPRDLDLAFFDPARLDPAHDAEVEQALTARLPGVPWDAKNQAAVHTWYGRVFGGEAAPLTSSADGVATWPETATAVAVRLHDDDRIQVVAPCGLDDLFGLVCRRNPRRVSVEHYRRRVRDKRIADRWPRVAIIGA
jgi:hypothetical protein